MQLVPNSKLYGQPARIVRDCLREAIWMQVFDSDDLRGWLRVSVDEADTVVTGLLADDHIEPAPPRVGIPQYRLTRKGTQLGMASIAPQLRRAVAEQLLAEVIARAADTEAQRPFVYQVTKIALFGSMLGDAPLVSDLDFAMKVDSAFEDEALEDAERRRIELAAHGGKRFRNMVASIVWPRMEVAEYLRAGSKYVKLHSFSELYELECPFRIVYERPEGDTMT